MEPSSLWQQLPEILLAAASSVLGIIAFCIAAAGVVLYGFLRKKEQSEWVSVAALGIFFVALIVFSLTALQTQARLITPGETDASPRNLQIQTQGQRLVMVDSDGTEVGYTAQDPLEILEFVIDGERSFALGRYYVDRSPSSAVHYLKKAADLDYSDRRSIGEQLFRVKDAIDSEQVFQVALRGLCRPAPDTAQIHLDVADTYYVMALKFGQGASSYRRRSVYHYLRFFGHPSAWVDQREGMRGNAERALVNLVRLESLTEFSEPIRDLREGRRTRYVDLAQSMPEDTGPSLCAS